MRPLAAALAALAVATACGCGPPPPSFPEMPALSGMNGRSIQAFRDADRAARSAPDAPDCAGRLGMRYHAYQLFDEARSCYRRARALDPSEFRWVYYEAMLEKTTYHYEPSERLFLRALEMRPDSAELEAELGDLYLLWARRDAARERIDEALRRDPLQPVAALGKARLLTLDQRWSEVIALLEPLLERYPRLSQAHKFLAAAYGALGDEERRAHHQDLGEYGAAVESPLMKELHELAVPPILEGDPARGAELLQAKCARCHNHERIYDHHETRFWWGATVRRMQRQAGWAWLTDDEASAIVAYLADRQSRGP